MQQDFDIKTYVDIARRRYLLFLGPVIVILALVCVVAFQLPRIYQATATILVESQRIPTDLASPTVTAPASERIALILERLMTRDRLLQIAEKFDLYRDQERLSPTGVVEHMREATEIGTLDIEAPVSRASGTLGFTISFEDRDPAVAAAVANELVASILSENLQSRLSRANETSRFFRQRLGELDTQLLTLEDRIAAYKRENEAALPESLPFLRTQLLQLSDQIAEHDGKIALASQPAELAGFSSEEARSLEFRLRSKQLALDSIQDQRDDLAPLAEKGYVPTNRIRELDRAIDATELDIDAIKLEIASKGGVVGSDGNKRLLAQLEIRRAELEERAAAVNNNILRAPQVEAELNALTRDYESLQAEHRQVQAKLAEAAVGERLEEDRQAERFEVFEQATVPESPAKPEKKKIIMAGSFVSFAAGVGAVLLAELLDKSIRTVTDLEKRLQLRPIAVIPYVTTVAERRRKSWRLVALLLLIATTAVVTLLLLHWYYLPLDLLAQRIGERIGF